MVTNLVSDQPGVAGERRPGSRERLGAWRRCPPRRGGWPTTDRASARCIAPTAARFGLTVAVPDDPTGTVVERGLELRRQERREVGSRHCSSSRRRTDEILGWNPNVAATPPRWRFRMRTAPSTRASRSLRPPSGDRLYATDFHNGRVDVFDGSFTNVTAPGSFTDSRIPSGYAPFGIQNVGGKIVVTYAEQDSEIDTMTCQGWATASWISSSTSGTLLTRVASRRPAELAVGHRARPGRLRQRRRRLC